MNHLEGSGLLQGNWFPWSWRGTDSLLRKPALSQADLFNLEYLLSRFTLGLTKFSRMSLFIYLSTSSVFVSKIHNEQILKFVKTYTPFSDAPYIA